MNSCVKAINSPCIVFILYMSVMGIKLDTHSFWGISLPPTIKKTPNQYKFIDEIFRNLFLLGKCYYLHNLQAFIVVSLNNLKFKHVVIC